MHLHVPRFGYISDGVGMCRPSVNTDWIFRVLYRAGLPAFVQLRTIYDDSITAVNHVQHADSLSQWHSILPSDGYTDCCRPKCVTLHSRKRTGVLPERTHMEDEDEDHKNDKGRWERRWRVQSGESKRDQNEHCACSMDDVMRTTILSQCHVRHWNECGENTRKCDVWGCSVHTHHSPSVAADCYQL